MDSPNIKSMQLGGYTEEGGGEGGGGGRERRNGSIKGKEGGQQAFNEVHISGFLSS